MKITIDTRKMVKKLLEDEEEIDVLDETDRTMRHIHFTPAELTEIVTEWVKLIVAELVDDAGWYATCSASNFYKEFDKAVESYYAAHRDELTARYYNSFAKK